MKFGVRAASVALLVAGAAAGVHLGEARELPQPQSVVANEEALLKQRHARHIADRASRTAAEGQAAAKAASQVKVAAGQARALERKRKEKQAEQQEKPSGSVPYPGKIPQSCAEFKGNRATGCALMLKKGFAIAEFGCLEQLWTKESGWNHLAENPSSGAYGIPQAFPGKKMASAGDDWRINAATQITWGLGYIKGRYRSPCGAWSHWQNNHSY
ncbi:lytic transglycosylase domain-containing protein [Actinoplanes sp. NPDC024001]|uniref:aggregation-promoting factor C-terminal-like domain-containing protein n=1 Tax=Actinoplanes sp. NPDC024001 TaxID=3154598 RepID=UPI0033E5C22E